MKACGQVIDSPCNSNNKHEDVAQIYKIQICWLTSSKIYERLLYINIMHVMIYFCVVACISNIDKNRIKLFALEQEKCVCAMGNTTQKEQTQKNKEKHTYISQVINNTNI